jgi:hypothetical protein
MTTMEAMEKMMDLCDRFITSIHIKGEYRKEIDAWLNLEEACNEWYLDIF